MNYTPGEFRDTLYAIAEGRIDTRPMLTGTTDAQGVAQAFDDLRDAERHAKIVLRW
ncbi:MAG: hypothetical protein ABW164_10145 [Sphingobium sp.]